MTAEVTFHLQDQAADPARGIARPVCEQLLDVGIHAGRRLARADGADDGHARVQAALRNDQPVGIAGALDRGAAVLLTEDEEEILARFRRGIRR